MKVAGAFSNGLNDIVYVDNSGAGGSTVTVGRVLTNNGTLSIGNTSQTKATKVTAAGLAGAFRHGRSEQRCDGGSTERHWT